MLRAGWGVFLGGRGLRLLGMGRGVLREWYSDLN